MKKFVMTPGLGAIQFMRLGYFRIFQRLGWDCKVWDQNAKPAFDMFAEWKPDILMMGSYEIDRATFKNLMSHPELQLILWCPNFGDADRDIDYAAHGVLRAKPQEIEYVRKIKEVNNLQYCFTYYHQNCVDYTHNSWRDVGIEPVGITMAADLFDYPEGEYRDEFDCDAAFVGGYWPYKAINLNKYLIPLCNNLKVKIFGGGYYPVANHLGTISTENMKHLYKSAKVCPCVYEPLSTEYHFDVSERVFKVMSSGGFAISQVVESLRRDILTNSEVVFADSPDDFREKVIHFAKYPDDRLPYLQRSREYVFRDGTYFHRAMKLCELFGWNSEHNMLTAITTQLNKVNNARS